jgi:excisionase family DNA binding protein
MSDLGGSNRLLTMRELADYLNQPYRSVQVNWARWGIPAYRVGRSLRFRVRAVEQWLDGRAA